MTGDLEMHPLFLTIANIHLSVRMKATSHAWACIGYIPTPEFLTHSDFHSVLEGHLWHRCLDIICSGLKVAASIGTFMTDPNNCTWYTFTPLAAYTADLLEQQMIACVTKSASLVTMAELNQFGDGVCYPPREGKITLQKLYDLCASSLDPWRLREFLATAKAAHLNGVQLPFFHDWQFSDPSIFLVGEILHAILKLFFDHPFKWCKELLGTNEIDTHYRTQHKHVGVHHFKKVSHVKQMTGRDHQDLARTIVATIAGVVDPSFICTIRSLVDFIYQSQSPTFTESSICDMERSLLEFHRHKHAILEAGAQRGNGPLPDSQAQITPIIRSHDMQRRLPHPVYSRCQ